MTNQVTQDAEESATIEKTASEVTETTNHGQTQSSDAVGENEAIEPQADEGTADAAPAQDTASAAAPASAGETPPAAQTEPERTETAVAEVPNSEAAPIQAPAAVEPSSPSAPQPAAADGGEIDFGAILEQFEQEQTVFHSGEMVTGTVVGISDRGVLVDFGFKSEGFVPVEEFTGHDGQLTTSVGETVEVVIRSMHAGDGAPQLSRLDALGRKVWDDVETAYQSGTPVTGRVVDKTKGGLKIDLNGIEAFLPGSQIDSRPIRGLDTYIGQDIEAKIIKFSRRRNNIVLSRKVITDEIVNAQKAETLDKLEVGYIVDGTIKNLTEYGAFVDIGGIDGLLHVTDMSWGRIHHPSDQFKVGQHLQIKVLKLDREKEKISLGYKQLQPDPWSTVVEVYPVNSKIKGTVSSVTDYGVFVELEPGVEGLVHVSEISWARRAQSPKRLFHKGQEVDVQVLGVDTDEKRISLGMKQFQDNPWDTVDLRYPIGSKVHGRVRNLTDFGAFVELEEGIDGLVHVSDITWAKKIKHPKDVLKKDQEVDAIVTSIDKRGQRLSLSMKDLTPSAWETFVATHRPGDVVRGKVSRFTNFGVFVELGEGLEGLCHISELSDERVDRPESVASLGQEMDFKILRIEPSDQKIGLSHRAVGKDDEPVADTKMYSTEAKGGMASLGELANLRFNAAEASPQKDPETRRREKQAAKEKRAEAYAAREAEAAAAAAAAESAPETEAEAPSTEIESNEVGDTGTPADDQAQGETIDGSETEAAVIETASEDKAEEDENVAEDNSADKEQVDTVPSPAETELEAAPAEESAAASEDAPAVSETDVETSETPSEPLASSDLAEDDKSDAVESEPSGEQSSGAEASTDAEAASEDPTGAVAEDDKTSKEETEKKSA